MITLFNTIVATASIFQWTDDGLGLLLRKTLTYKAKRFADNINWESSTLKVVSQSYLGSTPTQRSSATCGYIAHAHKRWKHSGMQQHFWNVHSGAHFQMIFISLHFQALQSKHTAQMELNLLFHPKQCEWAWTYLCAFPGSLRCQHVKTAAAGWRLQHLFAPAEQLRFFVVIFSILAERSCHCCAVCVGGIRPWNSCCHMSTQSAVFKHRRSVLTSNFSSGLLLPFYFTQSAIKSKFSPFRLFFICVSGFDCHPPWFTSVSGYDRFMHLCLCISLIRSSAESETVMKDKQHNQHHPAVQNKYTTSCSAPSNTLSASRCATVGPETLHLDPVRTIMSLPSVLPPFMLSVLDCDKTLLLLLWKDRSILGLLVGVEVDTPSFLVKIPLKNRTKRLSLDRDPPPLYRNPPPDPSFSPDSRSRSLLSRVRFLLPCALSQRLSSDIESVLLRMAPTSRVWLFCRVAAFCCGAGGETGASGSLMSCAVSLLMQLELLWCFSLDRARKRSSSPPLQCLKLKLRRRRPGACFMGGVSGDRGFAAFPLLLEDIFPSEEVLLLSSMLFAFKSLIFVFALPFSICGDLWQGSSFGPSDSTLFAWVSVDMFSSLLCSANGLVAFSSKSFCSRSFLVIFSLPSSNCPVLNVLKFLMKPRDEDSSSDSSSTSFSCSSRALRGISMEPSRLKRPILGFSSFWVPEPSSSLSKLSLFTKVREIL